MSDADLDALVREILESKKYRDMALEPATVRDLLAQELPRYRSRKEALDEVRKKLHNIVAPYLGDPDYTAAAHALTAAAADGALRAACLSILAAHASTKERIPILEEFYARLFALTGPPRTVLDLACALHPFGFPWMGLPASTKYYAYDIHAPRLALINHFFGLVGLEPLAIQQDILVEPPRIEADVAFFFKEAHRFEQRQRGSSHKMLSAVRAHWLLVSLPTASLNGKHNLLERQRALVTGIVAGEPWMVRELIFDNEIVFCIRKEG